MSDARKRVTSIAKDVYEKNGFFNQTSFRTDLRILFTVKKMIRKFLTTGNINEKLLINNIIIVTNVFTIEKMNILFQELLNANELSVLKSFLIFIGADRLPKGVPSNRVIDDILGEIYHVYHQKDD